ncbi:MAG: acyl carrier protein [Kiritimatiellia bacterium]|jgi:acyl carrier protein
MNPEDIDIQLKEMIVDRLFLKLDPYELRSDASLIDEYGVDSVCLLELVVGLEEAFGIVVEDGDFQIANFETVDALSAFVQSRLPARPGGGPSTPSLLPDDERI